MSNPAELAAQRIYTPNVVHNQALTNVKFISACFAGAVAGTLGLENWNGFGLFAASTLLTSACIYAINCKSKPARYIPGGVTELLNPGQDNVFTFLLAWTLFYGIVHGTTVFSSFTHTSLTQWLVLQYMTKFPPQLRQHMLPPDDTPETALGNAACSDT